MAISDKYLPGNLNQAEMDTVKGIPMSIFNNLSSKEQRQVLGLSGNLNRAELNQLQGSEPKTEFEILIGQLIAAGVPREEVLRIIQSRMDAMNAEPLMSTAEGQFGGSPHSGGPFWRQYNQGGIVSLRHLTRPLGI